MPAGIMTQTARGRCNLPTNSSSVKTAGGTLALELLDGIGIHVEDNTFVPVAHQTANDVGTHPAQTDHSQLHGNPLRSMVSST
mgnify:CR=1 FL=1